MGTDAMNEKFPAGTECLWTSRHGQTRRVTVVKELETPLGGMDYSPPGAKGGKHYPGPEVHYEVTLSAGGSSLTVPVSELKEFPDGD